MPRTSRRPSLSTPLPPKTRLRKAGSGCSAGCAGPGSSFSRSAFSPPPRRIVSLNLAGLIALVASILYLSQFRAGLIDARAQNLQEQAEIIRSEERRVGKEGRS